MSGIHAERLIRALGRFGWTFHTAREILKQAGLDEETFFSKY
jgi:hypothetical protein